MVVLPKLIEERKLLGCVSRDNIMNPYGEVTIVLPFRPSSKQVPYAVNVKASPGNGLDQDRFLDVGQIRAVSYQRLRNLARTLETKYWQQLQQALNIVLVFD